MTNNLCQGRLRMMSDAVKQLQVERMLIDGKLEYGRSWLCSGRTNGYGECEGPLKDVAIVYAGVDYYFIIYSRADNP